MTTWAAESECRACSPAEGKVEHKNLPFTDREDLLTASHEGVWLNRCSACNRPWLHLWVEIFDDGWAYWAPISEAEYGSFSAMDGNTEGHEMVEWAKGIVRRGDTLQRHPLYGLHWICGLSAILDGPPW